MLGPAAVTSALADLGAEVIKVEPPSGDYVRGMTWPIVEGVSLLHLHVNRAKKGIVLDLRTEDGKAVFLDLVKGAAVVVEAMRPGGLARRGLGYDDLVKVNPEIVFATVSGYGTTGPYKDYPSHGIAYDTWAGVVTPEVDEEGFTVIGEHVSIGINAAPLFGSIAILAAVLRARETGEGCALELAQSDAAAAFDWYRSESHRAYQRPESEVTGNAADNYERRPVATAGMREGVRYQIYATKDGHVLFMASEQAFWKNFCQALDRMDMFERWPGSKYADHARGNREMQRELTEIFKTKTSAEWLEWGGRVNTPIAPVNTAANIGDDPQFQARLPWISKDILGADQLGFPVNFEGEVLPTPTKAPTLGEHTDEVLRGVLGYDKSKIAALHESGALGAQD